MAVEHTIPLIDISPFLDPSATQDARDTVIEAVREAAQVYGFFQLTGHGIPINLQRQILKCAATFFALPQEEKSALHMSNAMGQSNRGYEKIGGQTLQDNARPDLKEGIYFGEDVPADDPRAGRFLQGPNQWPKLPRDEFHAPIMDYRKRLLDLSNVLLRIIAEGLPYGPNIFDDFVVGPVGNVRLLHYPPQESKDELQLGAGAHTDFGCLTLLLQQPDQIGLQVLYAPTNSWIPVPAIEGVYVVNIGDMLDSWTKGYFRSAVHRVVNHSNNDRYSVPFFFSGNMDTLLRPLDGSDDANAITVEQHILRQFAKSYKA